ncbi:hypothetical protein KMS_R03380 [Pseudomonas sp. LRP2-20]|uniref:hypothetical protein n=1 Tax=Pseudomonas sp. LRP2-20 TaxID=2944234 RepID=UPI002188C2B3|nr:hypothetical protein [Pseudomonas sp. LRP2-20]BDM20579.1 hypothetical protein KMS_R03380 [Pseudomonas sp. LRP2-20]
MSRRTHGSPSATSRQALTHTICENLIPLDHVVVITHYLMIAYNHSHRALIWAAHYLSALAKALLDDAELGMPD